MDNLIVKKPCRGGCGCIVASLKVALNGCTAVHEAHSGYCKKCSLVSTEEIIKLQQEEIELNRRVIH